jgi:hypothetical protein
MARASFSVSTIVRGVAHTEADGDRRQEVLDVLLIGLRAGDAPHAEPQVVVGGEEQIADQHRLDDEQPGEAPPIIMIPSAWL